MGANFFLYEMTPIYMGGNNETDRVASPASVPVQLKRRFDGDNIGTVILAIKACMSSWTPPRYRNFDIIYTSQICLKDHLRGHHNMAA